MAFNNKRSWRLKFIDIDSSFTLIPSDDPINGYIVARAPKGNQRPQYFPKRSSQAIDALCGVGSAHWPDLLEAKSYNDEYPIYISSPPGTSSAYPSEIGGFYITKNGMYKFYGITDMWELADNTGKAYKVKVQPGREHLFSADFSNRRSRIIIQSPSFEDYVPAEDEPGFGIFELRKGAHALILEKDRRLNVTEIEYDTMRNGLVSPVGTESTYWGDNDPEMHKWYFQGQTATLEDFGFTIRPQDRNPIASEMNPGDDELVRWIGSANYKQFILHENGPDFEGLMKLFVDGWVIQDEVLYYIPFGLQDIFAFLVTVKDDTLCYFAQKSPTEIPTDIKISQIGYDKYRYDRLFGYAPYDKDIWDEERQIHIKTDPSMSAEDRAKLERIMEEHDYIAFYDPDRPHVVFKIGEYYNPADDDEDSLDPPYYVDVTGRFVTSIFTCQDAVWGDRNEDMYHKIFRIESATEIKHLMTEEENTALYGSDGPDAYIKGIATGDSAPKDVNFNTITIGCSEEVYAGKTTSGGTFHGSLDDLGRDSFGSLIYFPEILQDDDMSFIIVRVLKMFGEDVGDLDESGFWTHKRIVDPYDMDRDGNYITERNFTIEGDRYATLVMMMNLLENKTGGVWRNEWYQIINDGLIEALLPEYDDVFIYMEPTGQELFKNSLRTISIANELAAVISPKILQPNNRGVLTAQIAERVIVNGRINTKPNAQYAGEFEYFDPISLKKYWRQPIGDIACNIARIFEKKYGGWAPAWYNIAGDLGGQLKTTVIRSRYQFEDEATRVLDVKGVNPIAFTSDDGLMILSQRTTQDPNFLSDWSYMGHALSFALVKRHIRDQVMRPQIMKPINSYWMSLRQGQVENILAKRTGGSSPIWAIAICDIEGQNTNLTRAQRNFVIKVDVKVNVFSETVTLILENHAQDWG